MVVVLQINLPLSAGIVMIVQLTIPWQVVVSLMKLNIYETYTNPTPLLLYANETCTRRSVATTLLLVYISFA